MENEILQNKTLAYIGAGICALAMTAAAWGLGSIEAIALYILVIAILMII